MKKEQCKNCGTVQIPNVSGCTCYGKQTNSWEDSVRKETFYRYDGHIGGEAEYTDITDDVVDTIKKIVNLTISQEREKWEAQKKEEDNYQCVDCTEWNVKSPLTQCSECRRQD